MIYDITRVRYLKRQACNLIGGSREPGEFFFVIVLVTSRGFGEGIVAIGGNQNVRLTWRAVIRSAV